MKKQLDKTNYLLNHKGMKYKANTLLGVIWRFITKKQN
jgi:hypothetical protein